MSLNTDLVRNVGISGSEEWLLKDARQLNFFIGPNNSGKSRLLRELFIRKSDELVFDCEPMQISKVAGTLLQDLSANHIDIQPITGLNFIREMKLKSGVNKIKNHALSISGFLNELYDESKIDSNYTSSYDQDMMVERINKWSKEKFSTHLLEFYHEQQKQVWQKIYIPTLRSLRQVSENDIFEARTTKDYFSTANKHNGAIFTGHSLYEDLKEHLLGSHEKRQKVRDFEEYLSENFFFGNDISLVPMVNQDVVYVREGDDEDRPIYDLGDGIQSIIILTFKVFMAEKPTLFFIEEPEHYLHAGLQRTLIETFAKHKEHMFFMTTHSNHFLDLAQERNDVSIQQVSRQSGETRVQPALELGGVLSELGVRASSVLLANCSIWVEGVTDKLYLRAYLRKFIDDLDNTDRARKLNSLHENLHYVFTEYQGSNITHWDFSSEGYGDNAQTPAKKLSQNILLIADADIDGKGSRVEVLDKDLGNNFYLLDWKEIENYIPCEMLIETAKRRWQSFNGKKGCSINRFENIKDKSKFETKSSGVGEILERFVDKSDGLKRNFYKDKSGTIKDKVRFCKTAIEVMNESNDWSLTPELEKLCDHIWKFIEKHNP